jgi:hypothetical protein
MGPNTYYEDGMDGKLNQVNKKCSKSEIIKTQEVPNPYIVDGSTENMKSLRQKKEIVNPGTNRGKGIISSRNPVGG